MKRVAALLALVTAAGCISKPQEVKADHLLAKTGTVSLEGIHSVRFRTRDGFQVSTSGGYGELRISETTVCGPLSLYRASHDAPSPSWAPAPSAEYKRFQSIDCIARDNIASTTMTVNKTDAVASAACVALLPLCVLAHSVPGQ
jgi:hypothetical protein